MAKEITVRASLAVRKGFGQYSSNPSGFTADMNGEKGPSPGTVTVSVGGTDIDLSELTEPGLCRIMNMDPTNMVQWGVWDSDTSLFMPVGEILPGESYVVRLSRNLGEEYTGTGTGTTSRVNTLRMKADKAPCVVLVEAFDR